MDDEWINGWIGEEMSGWSKWKDGSKDRWMT